MLRNPPRRVVAIGHRTDPARGRVGDAAGNAVLGGLLLALLARSVGPGMASALILLSGVAGTLAAAGLTRHNFVSIGASTAVFGALGALAALPRDSRRVWMPLVGGLGAACNPGNVEERRCRRPSLRIHLRSAGRRGGVAPAAAAEPGCSSDLAVAAGCVPVAAWLAAFR